MNTKKQITRLAAFGLVVLSFLVGSSRVLAEKIAYGNNAGGAGIYKIDLDTGNVLQTYVNSNGLGGNGRGVVVVGNTIYSTVVGDNKIYMTNATTGAGMGSIATTVGSMSTIGWDGKAFWTTDYAGSNKGYQIDILGNTIKTLSFSEATGYMDGMEYFNGKLIVNNTDGGFNGPIRYSIYDLNGALLQKDFITSLNGTGIAYDGTNFLVSDIRGTGGKDINVYSGTTGAYLSSYTVNKSWLVEDLSVDYAERTDTGGGNRVPDSGTTVTLLGSALVGLSLLRRRFLN